MKLSLSDELKPYWFSVRYSLHCRQFGACFADWLIVLRNDWINECARRNEKKKVPIRHEIQQGFPVISQQICFVNRHEHHLPYETKSQLKKWPQIRIPPQRNDISFFHSALKMKFSLNPQEGTLNDSVLYSAQQTHLTVLWPRDCVPTCSLKSFFGHILH